MASKYDACKPLPPELMIRASDDSEDHMYPYRRRLRAFDKLKRRIKRHETRMEARRTLRTPKRDQFSWPRASMLMQGEDCYTLLDLPDAPALPPTGKRAGFKFTSYDICIYDGADWLPIASFLDPIEAVLWCNALEIFGDHGKGNVCVLPQHFQGVAQQQ